MSDKKTEEHTEEDHANRKDHKNKRRRKSLQQEN